MRAPLMFIVLELRKTNLEEGDGRSEQSQTNPRLREKKRPRHQEKILSNFCGEVNRILYQPTVVCYF